MELIRRGWRRLRDDALLRHSVLLLAAAQVVNAANVAFQWALMRGLPAAEYGATMAVLGAAMALAVPLEALRAAVGRQVARMAAAGAGAPALRRAVARWLRALAAVAAALMGLSAFARPLASALSLDPVALVPLGAFALAMSLLLPPYLGALQGVESFGRMTVAGLTHSVGRLAIGTALVFGVSATAAAAVAGQALGCAIAAAVGYAAWRSAAARFEGRGAAASADPGARADEGYFFRALVVLAAFGALLNADVPLAKRYFSAEVAGAFARAATIARAVVFLPMPIAIAVFPKIVARAADDAERRALERRAALMTAALIAAATAGAWFFGGWLWRVFVGRDPTLGELRRIRELALAMAPLGGIYLQVNVLLARGAWRRGLWLVPAALGYALAVARRHEDPSDIARALGIAAAAGLIAMTFFHRPDETRAAGLGLRPPCGRG